MNLNYVKISPSQNMTIFITDYVDRNHQMKISEQIIAYHSLHGEQLGYIERPNDPTALIRMQMSGGEFCGNATLAAAAFCRHKQFTKDNNFFIEVSGLDQLLACHCIKQSNFDYYVSANMPTPTKTENIFFQYQNDLIEIPIVHMKGISHAIFNFLPKTDEYDVLMDQLIEQTNLSCLGIIAYQNTKEINYYQIIPYVYVASTASRIFEKACGSGSLALAYYLNKKIKSQSFFMQQEGGTIEVSVADELTIATKVHIVSEGLVYV